MLVYHRKNSLWKSNIPRLESPAFEVKWPLFILIDSSSLFLMGLLLTLQGIEKII